MLWLLTLFPSTLMNNELGEMIHVNALAHRVKRSLRIFCPHVLCQMSELFNLWDKLCAAPSSCCALEEELGIKARSSCELSKCSITGPHPSTTASYHSSQHAWKEPAISPRIFLGFHYCLTGPQHS